MKVVSGDRVHCFRHACTHSRETECPHCELERLRREALQAQVESVRAFNQRILDQRLGKGVAS